MSHERKCPAPVTRHYSGEVPPPGHGLGHLGTPRCHVDMHHQTATMFTARHWGVTMGIASRSAHASNRGPPTRYIQLPGFRLAMPTPASTESNIIPTNRTKGRAPRAEHVMHRS